MGTLTSIEVFQYAEQRYVAPYRAKLLEQAELLAGAARLTKEHVDQAAKEMGLREDDLLRPTFSAASEADEQQARERLERMVNGGGE
jgi:hypothetical protein